MSLVAAAVLFAGVSGSETPTCDGHPHFHGVTDFASTARKAYNPKYWREGVPNWAANDMRHIIDCAASPSAGVRMKTVRGRKRLRLKEYRRYRRVAPYRSPVGSGPPRPADKRWWAIPAYIVCGESRFDFSPGNSDGVYQIIPSTWHAFGGGRFASVAGAATPLEQHIVAAAAWGKTAWYGAC